LPATLITTARDRRQKRGTAAPNHYLSSPSPTSSNIAGVEQASEVGKTVVSSQMIDRVAASLCRRVYEVPVGFKWFVDASSTAHCASQARRRWRVAPSHGWERLTTDKDGIVLALLARRSPRKQAAILGAIPRAHAGAW